MGITVMDILGAAEVQFTYRILPGVEISTKELDGMLAKLRETILRISKEEDKKEQTAIIPESIEKSEKIEDKNKLPYQDSAGENLYTGDIVFCKENYYLTICQDETKFYGKLINKTSPLCASHTKDRRYDLNEGENLLKIDIWKRINN